MDNDFFKEIPILFSYITWIEQWREVSGAEKPWKGELYS